MTNQKCNNFFVGNMNVMMTVTKTVTKMTGYDPGKDIWNMMMTENQEERIGKYCIGGEDDEIMFVMISNAFL